MRPAAAAFLLFFAVPACAMQELFEGLDPGWAQAEQALQEYKLEQARRERAKGPRLKPLGDLIKPHRVPKQDPSCAYAAVARWLGVDASKVKQPDVYYASRTLLHDYASWVIAERGTQAPTPRTIATTYLGSFGVIFMDDEGVAYEAARTIDDALAGQYALHLAHKSGKSIEGAEGDRIRVGIERRFNREYSSKGVSACAP